MTRLYGHFLRLVAATATLNTAALGAPLLPPAGQTIRDEVYLQEVGHQVPSATPLSGVAIFDNQVFGSSDQGLFRLEMGRLVPLHELSKPIRRIVATQQRGHELSPRIAKYGAVEIEGKRRRIVLREHN